MTVTLSLWLLVHDPVGPQYLPAGEMRQGEREEVGQDQLRADVAGKLRWSCRAQISLSTQSTEHMALPS